MSENNSIETISRRNPQQQCGTEHGELKAKCSREEAHVCVFACVVNEPPRRHCPRTVCPVQFLFVRKKRTDGDTAAHRNYYAQDLPINPLKDWSIWNLFKVEDGRDIDIETTEVNRTFPNHVGTQVESTERVFQDKINLCSETDIIKGCQTLNHAIYETALTLVDEWSKTPHNRDGLAQISLSTDDQNDLHHVLGDSLFRRVQRTRSSSFSGDLESWVTDALQVIAVDICYRAISHTFCPCLSRATNDEMQGVFDEMLSKGESSAFIYLS